MMMMMMVVVVVVGWRMIYFNSRAMGAESRCRGGTVDAPFAFAI
jgi:hypothetical protein